MVLTALGSACLRGSSGPLNVEGCPDGMLPLGPGSVRARAKVFCRQQLGDPSQGTLDVRRRLLELLADLRQRLLESEDVEALCLIRLLTGLAVSSLDGVFQLPNAASVVRARLLVAVLERSYAPSELVHGLPAGLGERKRLVAGGRLVRAAKTVDVREQAGYRGGCRQDADEGGRGENDHALPAVGDAAFRSGSRAIRPLMTPAPRS